MASEKMEKDIYNGDYHIIHNPNARGRAPRYRVINTKTKEETRPIGVTTVLGKTLAKDLIGWALGCMAEYLQEKLPVITQADLDEAQKESTKRRDSGASTGTEAHAMVEVFLKGLPVEATKRSPEAMNAFGAFVKWFEEVKPKVLGVEEVVYSPILGFAGTYDCLLQIDGKNYLCDFKTTNASKQAPAGVYPENFIQLGAYWGAHEEQRLSEGEKGKLPKIEGLMVISGKKNGQLDIVTNEDVGLTIEDCSQMFYFTMGLHDNIKRTREILGGKK